ncbi:MAG: phosphoglycerate dehydrogenase, partial [Chloroflexi bacterium]|nr:phosphoglycerate dehydrogenase [Chloroflexota bacterium]
MEPTPVLYAMPYGPSVYAIVAAECPPELRVDFLEHGTGDELLARLADYEFVIGGRFQAAHFAVAPRLRLLQAAGVGTDGTDLEAARARGVLVATTPEGTVEGVAEHVVLLILAVNKQLLLADRALREGRWLVWELRPTSHLLAGLTVGLVGLGRIGQAVARRLRGFAVTLVYHDPVRPAPAVEAELGAGFLPLDDLLRVADVVSLHTPLTPATRDLIGARQLALMKPTAILVNT